ncbi:hypothetical protein CPLU01_04435 [Colletotrichum plurivorum]|uniref:Uncharacterized protein n=1 Tax=Colletotrichum plurivorum TaxID=2175906 RepID=A0A8H6NJX9_9PEZI|nr:hypothetical protein CPLU01_04435 [Colletotrichum plurivorum]
MKFFTALTLLALGVTTHAACTVSQVEGTDPNCCWGGDDGWDACLRQNGYIGCTQAVETNNFCKNHGIPNTMCKADCCDLRTGKGKACPKGKNRCDEDSGCPH